MRMVRSAKKRSRFDEVSCLPTACCATITPAEISASFPRQSQLAKDCTRPQQKQAARISAGSFVTATRHFPGNMSEMRNATLCLRRQRLTSRRFRGGTKEALARLAVQRADCCRVVVVHA